MARLGAIVVTGSGSGIGQALALRLGGAGHGIIGMGRNLEKLQATAKQLPAGRMTCLAADLSSASAATKAAVQVRTWLGDFGRPLLALVNNAGVFDRLAFDSTDESIWERHFQNNLMSAIRLTKELHSQLKLGRPASVLNISSTLGLRPIANTSAYSAMKAAMINWTKTLALEWAGDGIRVNCLCPGLVDTPIHAFHGESDESATRRQGHAAQPLGRMGTAGDIAAAAEFLLSSEWTTGTVLTVDGGISL
jgi:NAD(P)-dependent dehydrogenase (short-subunit alcohol dehydrogenase family)